MISPALRRLAGMATLALVVSACGVDTASDTPAPAPAPAESPSAPSGGGTASSDGFEWTAVEFGCDFVDDVEARGRVTNTSSSTVGSAGFTITVLQDGRIAATLTGFVNDLEPGATKTVEFISLDDCLEGDFTFEIQSDFSFGGGSSGGSLSGADGEALEWSLVDIGCDFIDDFEARGRVQNTGDQAISSAAFTMTLFQDGRIVATLTGFVNDLAPGATKTVEFISIDDCIDGDVTYEIQTDFAL